MNKNEFDQYAQNVGAVIAMRMAFLPMWWMTDPVRAQKETKKMFAEKEDALAEMHRQMVLAPMHFYQELWSGMLRGDIDGGVSKAFCAASRKMTTPYTSRVGANRKRLSKG